MTNLIAIKDVTRAYRTKAGPLPVLDGLNVSVPEGPFAAVVGPSGCGKSTQTRLVAGPMKPDPGEVWLHGERVTSPRKTVGMAFQNPVLLEWRNILDNIMLPLEIVALKMPQAQREARAMELLEMVGRKGFERKRPSELSGGMRQRATLCRSIVHKSDVLIMDEPIGSLDAFAREDLWQTMRDLRAAEPFAKDPARVLWRSEGLGHAGVHRHQPCGNRQPTWPWAGRAVQIGRDERGLPADVRGADRTRGVLGIVLYYGVLVLERIFAGWAERPQS